MAVRTNMRYEKKVNNATSKRVKDYILKEFKYSSLDAFALENHELVAKATLYSFCNHQRDIRLSSLSKIARALNISIGELFKDL